MEVAIPLPIRHTFTYSVEAAPPPIGTRVRVPFRREERIGWVVGEHSGEPVRGIKPVLAVLDDGPSVPPDLIDLCRWISEYYAAPLGIALKAALPSVLSDVSRDYIALTGRVQQEGLRPREKRLFELLELHDNPQPVRTLRKTLGMGSIWPEIRLLSKRQLIMHRTVPPAEPTAKTRRVVRIERHLESLVQREDAFGRAARQREAYELLEASGGGAELAHLIKKEGFSRAVLKGLEDKGLVRLEDEEVHRDPFARRPAPVAEDLVPTNDQQHALDTLVSALGAPPSPFLLQGITGSGKTLVYIELLRAALERGQSAIVLVPEIALTPQTASRFRAHFGDQVAVLHSGLSLGERYDAWRSLRAGDRRIAVGARSALFAPLSNLGVVVVDEEHDGSYKQSESPRYHARDLAIVRAKAHKAVCVLGSATPSMESWSNAQSGKFARLSLPKRVGGAKLPSVQVVDLRVGRSQAENRPISSSEGGGVLSDALVTAVRSRLRRQEQVILLHNRRGYSSFLQCQECGEVEECTNCSISLTYHKVTHRLLCHHCRYETQAPNVCLRCSSADLSYRGLGTEQVERVTAETFPEARIARMDMDTTSGKWAHQRILDRVEQGDVDILLGTQMIAKGLDFPRVTLVGVVNADLGIHLPDFRASERTFQLLSQVAGRAGRGKLGGEVLIQTALPEHYAIRAAVAHDFESFATRELHEREGPQYPPWLRLVNVILSSPDQALATKTAEQAVAWLRRWLDARDVGEAGINLVGPAPSPIERLHRRWRWHFLIKSGSPNLLGHVTTALAAGFKLPSGDVRLAIDRDPVALL